MNEMIQIYWSSMTCMQSSYYPHLYRALEALSKKDRSFNVIDVARHDYEYIKKTAQQADLIVIDHTINMSYALTLPDKLPEYTNYVNKPKKPEFYKDIWEFLFNVHSTKKVLVFAGDLHAISKSPAERSDALGTNYMHYLQAVDAVAWIYRPEAIPSISSLPPAYVESWMPDYEDSRQLAIDIKKLIPTVIELPLCIAQSEIHKPKQVRWDVAMPGASYKTRQIALESISRHNQITIAPYNEYVSWQDRIIYYLKRTKLFSERAVTRVKYPIAHFLQEKILSSSDVTYTCGGPLRYFVRKFFEIPASGSLMLADMPDYAADYGFIDNENYIQTTPEEAGLHLKSILNNPGLKKQIKANGSDLIQKLHTADKRAEHFIHALKTLVARPYREARFISGTYTIVD